MLLDASEQAGSSFEVAAVVTQPGKPKGRGNKSIPQPSPVEVAARGASIAADRIWTPAKAHDAEFLEQLALLHPDLCVTAAYGNILPQRFLDIPRFGTLNIHPSLLPKYRGAAPVQRALQDGVAQTGVSVAFTVRAMDAGPVLAQEVVDVGQEIQAPELLQDLFKRGGRLLLDNLDSVWEARAATLAKPQDESQVTHAAKLTKEEGVLDFRQPAHALHAKVRAFAGWPGTSHPFVMEDANNGGQLFNMKVLEILEVQPVGKKIMPVKAFVNGLKGRRLFWQPLHQS
ncbi:hypothetical protein WJX72_010930 [[Myrmecia] bisecta]|uniref:methionyl-tRNA formyltransferase n=1 Tax=[Myrmecia] bisecta TaxID=41462 RepID=A0AAW1R8I1_9CHLO